MPYLLFSGEGIGTHWQIDCHGQVLPEAQVQSIQRQISALIENYDLVLSRFRPDSLITRMAKEGGTHSVPDFFIQLFLWYKKLYNASQGAVTPLIGQTLVDAGYDADYSLKSTSRLTSPPSWDEVMRLNHSTISLNMPALLDVGAAGKGQLIDLVSVLLERQGIPAYTIDAGGDILHKNKANTSIRVGLENPKDFNMVIGHVDIANKSICASAGSRRKWDGFHHIINPHTLHSPTEIIATWVIADSAMHADGLATCLFFVAPEQLSSLGSFEYLILNKHMHVARSPGFEATLY